MYGRGELYWEKAFYIWMFTVAHYFMCSIHVSFRIHVPLWGVVIGRVIVPQQQLEIPGASKYITIIFLVYGDTDMSCIIIILIDHDHNSNHSTP